MRKFSLTTLLAGAVLLATMATTTLSAESMKCGTGKCGSSVEASGMKKPACCEAKAPEFKKPACCQAKAEGKECTCPREVSCKCKDPKNCTCGANKKAKQAPAMKCGTGKCGKK